MKKPRPEILSINYTGAEALAAAYLPSFKPGTLFARLKTPLSLGEKVFLMVRYRQEAPPVPVTAQVAFIYWLEDSSQIYAFFLDGSDGGVLLRKIEDELAKVPQEKIGTFLDDLVMQGH